MKSERNEVSLMTGPASAWRQFPCHRAGRMQPNRTHLAILLSWGDRSQSMGRYHSSAIRLTKIKNYDCTFYWQNVGKTGRHPHTCWWLYKLVKPFMEKIWQHITITTCVLICWTNNPNSTNLPWRYTLTIKSIYTNTHIVIHCIIVYNCKILNNLNAQI